MKKNECMAKRNFMAQELFWPIYKTFRVQNTYSKKSINDAIDQALHDAYGIADAILDIAEED